MAQGLSAMHAPVVVVGNRWRVHDEPLVDGVGEGQPFSSVAGLLAAVFADAGAFVVQRAPATPTTRRRCIEWLAKLIFAILP